MTAIVLASAGNCPGPLLISSTVCRRSAVPAIVLASAGHCLQRFGTRVRACEQARSVQLFVDRVLVLRAAGQGLSEQTLNSNAVFVFVISTRDNAIRHFATFCHVRARTIPASK